MLTLLERIDPEQSRPDLLVALVASLRPRRPRDGARAAERVRTLCQLLKGNPAQALALRRYGLRLLAARRHASLYTDLGVLSNHGFFTELRRRLGYRILPPAFGTDHLSEALDQILYRPSDHQWIGAVPAADWLALFDAIAGADHDTDADAAIMLPGLLEAIRTLSYRICALGLEPELTRCHSEIETFTSPFTMQNVEVNAYLERHARLPDGAAEPIEDARHLLVMLDQCDAVVGKIRKKALHQGSSIALTHLLLALTQSAARLRKLLFLVDPGADLPGAPGPRRAAAVALALELIAAHGNQYQFGELFAENIDLLARNVTENASRTGEHYIAENRKELGAMLRSSAGAGFIIGFMALCKILLSHLRAAPLVEAFLFSINYAFGFILIHVLHCTDATKQPAMTAARIALGLHSREGREIDLDSMAELINKVLRTQLVAVLGNLASVLPCAFLIAQAYRAGTGRHLVNPDKARQLLLDIDPFGGPAVWYAMIAGVCLFVSGLISGYYDNAALYTRWASRVGQLRGLGRVIGPARLYRLGLYLENNLGGLMGNLYFGILLGCIGTLGFLLGLPLDIRHITFSAANLATALVGLDFQLSPALAARALAGVGAIGAANLAVSFGLALWVALRARQVRFRHGGALLRALGRRFRQAPLAFFIGAPDAPDAPDGAGDKAPK